MSIIFYRQFQILRSDCAGFCQSSVFCGVFTTGGFGNHHDIALIQFKCRAHAFPVWGVIILYFDFAVSRYDGHSGKYRIHVKFFQAIPDVFLILRHSEGSEPVFRPGFSDVCIYRWRFFCTERPEHSSLYGIIQHFINSPEVFKPPFQVSLLPRIDGR